jgi:hypothetical protein
MRIAMILAVLALLTGCDDGGSYPADDAYEAGYFGGGELEPGDPYYDEFEQGQHDSDCDYWKERGDYAKAKDARCKWAR